MVRIFFLLQNVPGTLLLTQQSPFPGQSVSLCPGLQQVETAPAHSSGDPGETAGQEPASSPPPEPPAVPNAPSAPPYRPSDASQSTLNHQSQLKSCWLKMVPLGQRKLTG